MSTPWSGAPVPISLYTGGELPPFQPGPLNFDYLLAGNGLFLRGQQGGLEVIVPVTTIRGLPCLSPAIRWDYPLVPSLLVAQMLEQALQARAAAGNLLEILFYLTWEEDGWTLHTPEQDQTPSSVVAREGERGVFVKALIEVHSHGALPPYFSSTDNRSEGLLRLYAVLGQVGTRPALRVRVGAYGIYQPIPAQMVFDLAGTGVVDAWLQEIVQDLLEGTDGPIF